MFFRNLPPPLRHFLPYYSKLHTHTHIHTYTLLKFARKTSPTQTHLAGARATASRIHRHYKMASFFTSTPHSLHLSLKSQIYTKSAKKERQSHCMKTDKQCLIVTKRITHIIFNIKLLIHQKLCPTHTRAHIHTFIGILAQANTKLFVHLNCFPFLH